MHKAVLQLEPLSCPSCIKKIEAALKQQNGIDFVKVLFNVGKVNIEFDEAMIGLDQIVKIIDQLGYRVLDQKAS